MPKIRTDYNKFSSDRRYVGKTEHTQSEEGYFEAMSGERVQVELTSGKQIEGVLSAGTYNRYDIVIESSGGRYLVPKAAILFVKHCKGDKMK